MNSKLLCDNNIINSNFDKNININPRMCPQDEHKSIMMILQQTSSFDNINSIMCQQY